MLLLILTNLLVILIHEISAADLPFNIPRCSMDDTEMDNCLLNATIVLKPFIRNGIKELGIPPYDPLIVSYDTTVDTDMAKFNCSITNITMRGVDNYDITEFKYDPKSLTFTGKFNFDPIAFDSKYEVDGQVINILVKGKGSFQIIMGPVNGTFKITGKIKKLKKIEHYTPVKVEVKLSIDDGSFNLDGLFDGDERLGMMTNLLLNQHSKAVIAATTSTYEAICEAFLMRYMKWLTKEYSYYTLFPRS